MSPRTYLGPQYIPANVVERMHNIPRNGHGDQISALASSDHNEQVDYVLGVIFIPLLMVTFLFYWIIIILLLKCLGKHKAGFLSGHRFVSRPNNSSTTKGRQGNKKYGFLSIANDDDSDDGQSGAYSTITGGENDSCLIDCCVGHANRSRTVFLTCGVLILIFCILLITEGLRNVDNTFSAVEKTAVQIRDILAESTTITTSLIRIGYNTKDIRDVAVKHLEGFCPAGEKVTKALKTDKLVGELTKLSDMIVAEATKLKITLGTIVSTADDAIDKVDQWANWGWGPAFLVLPYIVCSSILIVGTLMAWLGVSFRGLQLVETYIIIPLFSILSVVSWVVSCIIAMGAILNADLCMGKDETEEKGPEITLLNLLDKRGFGDSGLLYEILIYFVMGCASENPFSFISKYEGDLNEAVNQLQTFQDQIDLAGLELLSSYCGQDVSPMVGVLRPLSLNLVELLQIVGRTLSLISCQRINSLYVNTIHDATCTHSVSALTWVFSTLFMISFCGMIMLVLRSSTLENENLSESQYSQLKESGTNDEIQDTAKKKNEKKTKKESRGRVQSDDDDDTYYTYDNSNGDDSLKSNVRTLKTIMEHDDYNDDGYDEIEEEKLKHKRRSSLRRQTLYHSIAKDDELF